MGEDAFLEATFLAGDTVVVTLGRGPVTEDGLEATIFFLVGVAFPFFDPGGDFRPGEVVGLTFPEV